MGESNQDTLISGDIEDLKLYRSNICSPQMDDGKRKDVVYNIGCVSKRFKNFTKNFYKNWNVNIPPQKKKNPFDKRLPT